MRQRRVENSRHVWKIQDLRFWTRTSPIQGPDFKLDDLEDVKFCFHIEANGNNGVDFVFKGTATPTSPCWMPLRVSASVLSPEHEEISLASADVDPFAETSTTVLELRESEKWLDQENVSILVRTEERIVSTPTLITQEDRIPSSKDILMGFITEQKDRILPAPTSVISNTKVDYAFCYHIYRCQTPLPKDYVQFRYYSNKTVYPAQLRVHYTVLDARGKRRHPGRSSCYLFQKELEVWYLPEFLPLSILTEDETETRSVRKEVEYAYLDLSPTSPWRGSTHSTHNYRHHIVQESSDDPEIPRLGRDRGTDLELVTDDGQRFPVHRGVLAARSRYFSAMMSAEMAEKYQTEIALQSVDSSTLGELLDFLYTADIPEALGVKAMAELYEMANYFEVLELRQFCLHHISKKLRLSNAISALPVITYYDVPDLKTEVMGLITSNAEAFFQSPLWKKAEKEYPGFCKVVSNNIAKEMEKSGVTSSTRRSVTSQPEGEMSSSD